VKSHLHLLLADDNADEVFFIARALRETSWVEDLEIVSDGSQVIERFSADLRGQPSKPRPDAIILDLNMPGRTGFEVLEWMDKNHVDCPVIIHTSTDNPWEAAESARLGAKGFAVKKVGYRPLIQKLSEIL
jgi:CheY-like chemotaxis protein